MNYHKRFLELYTPLVAFTEQDWQLAAPYFSFHRYQTGDFIFTVDDSPESLDFVLEGVGRYYYVDKEGKERNKGLVRKGGAFVSLSSVISGARSPFYTQAISACATAKIRYKDILKLCDNSPNWNLFLRKSYEILTLKKEQREAGFLMMSATERYQQFLADFADEASLIPLRHVAMYIGITDVSLSRIRKQMDLT